MPYLLVQSSLLCLTFWSRAACFALPSGSEQLALPYLLVQSSLLCLTFWSQFRLARSSWHLSLGTVSETAGRVPPQPPHPRYQPPPQPPNHRNQSPPQHHRIDVYGHVPWSKVGSGATGPNTPPVGLLRPEPVYGQQPGVTGLQESSSFHDAGSSFYDDGGPSGTYARTYDPESSAAYSTTDSALEESSIYQTSSFDRLDFRKGKNAQYYSPRYRYD